MANTNGFDITGNLTVDYGSGYLANNLAKSFVEGFNFNSNPISIGTPYASSAPPKAFSGGQAITVVIDFGSDYVADIKRYRLFAGQGTIEASSQSRLLRPGDTGVDISFFNLDKQNETFIANY